MSIITYGMLRYRAEKSPDRDTTILKLERLIDIIPVQALSVDVADHYARTRFRLAHARRPEAFGDIVGLRTEDWTAVADLSDLARQA
jgi:predicted nucleic acid-binding protein